MTNPWMAICTTEGHTFIWRFLLNQRIPTFAHVVSTAADPRFTFTILNAEEVLEGIEQMYIAKGIKVKQ